MNLDDETKLRRFTPYNEAWARMSAGEIKAKKEEWKNVQYVLQHMKGRYLKGAFIRPHKHLFFKGELTVLPGRVKYWPFPNYHVFYLWYYPNLDDASCRKILEYDAYKSGEFDNRNLKALRHHMLDANSQFGQMRRGFYTENKDFEYGPMGDREFLIYKHILGIEEDCPFYDDRPDFYLDHMPFRAGNLTGWLSSTRAVLVGRRVSMNRAEQFLWPYISRVVKRQFSDPKYKPPHDLSQSFPDTVAMCLFFDDHPETAKDCQFAIDAKNRILTQLENGELDGPIADVFTKVKKLGLKCFIKR